MVLTRSEKENAVIDLYKQGKTYRQIAELLHVSFGDISFIIRRETGESEEQERMRMSKTSLAFKLFEQGNTPVQVSIKLDIETSEVDRLYKEYWNLKGLDKLNEVYARLKDDVFSFVKLYQLTKKEGLNQQQVVNAVKLAEKLPYLEAECQLMNDTIDELNEQKESIRKQFNFMLEEVKSGREYKDNQLKSMQQELELTQEHTYSKLKLEQEKLDEQKITFAEEVNNIKSAINELKSTKERIDKLKQEEQQLICRLELLNNEVLEILRYLEEARRRKQQQEQYIQESQKHQQLVYQQPVQQEMPNLSDEELRILAIPLICNNWTGTLLPAHLMYPSILSNQRITLAYVDTAF